MRWRCIAASCTPFRTRSPTRLRCWWSRSAWRCTRCWLDHRRPGEAVLVIGAGTLGLLTVAALRLVAPAAQVVLLARHDRQRRWGSGWAPSSRPAAEGRGQGRAAACRRAGASVHPGPGGADRRLRPGLRRGRQSLERGRRDQRRPMPGRGWCWWAGRRSSAGWTGRWPGHGSCGSTAPTSTVRSRHCPDAPHTMDEAIRLLAAHPELPIGEMVTHTFPLEAWRQAMRTVLDADPRVPSKWLSRP